ncbi:hypothetical protein AB0C07_21840 [Actinoplanes missouriensis]|uniref:hypothetical protein n=1 Tax=Actinoplanes missouriensis TaxID=1866 RepID=UPI00340A0496
MMRSRILPVVLLGACLVTLAACGDDSPSAASSAPAAPAAGSSAGGSSAGGSSAGGSSAAGVAPDDKALCKTLNTAATALRNGITNAQQDGGGVRAADAKKTFIAFHRTVTEALAFAPASDVTSAAKAIADELDAAAKSADPIGSAADSDFDKLGNDLTTACKAAGVTVMF